MDNEPKKRGRKSKNKNYFGPIEEEAVRQFLSLGIVIDDENASGGVRWSGSTSDINLRNKIFRESLYFPLNKMVESIIRKYKLYRKDMVFEDVHSDTLSFLLSKFHKFKPEKGKKAYSYFGTICKHFLIGQLMKDDKLMKQNISYEDIFLSIENDEKYSYELDENDTGVPELINDVSEQINKTMKNDDVTENEKKVGIAIICILKDWETIFDTGKGNNKYNKNLILANIREMTNLTTKEIRNSMKKYKKLYYIIKGDHIDTGNL
jgi:hypothetical protein